MAMAAALAAVLVVLSTGPSRAEGDVFDSIKEGLKSLWSFVTGAASTAGDAVTPPTSIQTLKSIRGEDKSEFWAMLEDAGYDLKEIDTEVGLIPAIEATYILTRELSEADREALDWRLEKFAKNSSGLIALIERGIIQSLLDASELGDYRVEKVKIQFLPLPKASFTLSPTDAPLEEEHDVIYRAVKEQRREMRRVGESMRTEHALGPASPRARQSTQRPE
ncbi:MAG: hypothetical protein HY246_05200 [Proteobacteria bacterium]|nr:hypothetical protein [Pseudomonadota bacterium]